MSKICENSNPNYGFNGQTDTYEDLVSTGVIDPTKVTTGSMIAGIPEKKAAAPGGPGPRGNRAARFSCQTCARFA